MSDIDFETTLYRCTVYDYVICDAATRQTALGVERALFAAHRGALAPLN